MQVRADQRHSVPCTPHANQRLVLPPRVGAASLTQIPIAESTVGIQLELVTRLASDAWGKRPTGDALGQSGHTRRLGLDDAPLLYCID